MAIIVAGDMYRDLDGKLFEIKRQLRQVNGYPYDPEKLSVALQGIIEGKFGEEHQVQVAEPQKPQPLILTGTGQTFADWLEARERLHEFLTGEKIVFRDIFTIDDATLVRTDIMPFFRPVGGTNRMALDWKVRLGMNASYEEADVTEYKNSGGLEVSRLGFINRSVRPDENTLGKNAKSPDGLLETKKSWLNLFGWSDVDNLHFLITGKHLDSVDTLTWFPDDRLPGDREVAHGYWHADYAQAYFYWSDRGHCFPILGARLAEFFPFKKS